MKLTCRIYVLGAALLFQCAGAAQAIGQLLCPGAEQVSIGIGRSAPNLDSREPAVPPHGNFILFSSKASNLSSAFISGTSSNTSNIYRYSPGRALELVSVNTEGKAPYKQDGQDLILGSLAPATTSELGDGSYGFVFHSDALDLLEPPLDGGGFIAQVYLRLPKIDRTVLISKDYNASGGVNVPGNGSSESATVAVVSSTSTSTTYRVCYDSVATNLVEGENENGRVVYCRDITVAGESISEAGTIILKPINLDSSVTLRNPRLSADGKTVTFESDATVIQGVSRNSFYQVYTYSFASQTMRLISRTASGFPAIGNSTNASISEDGGDVLFHYDAQNLPSESNLSGFEGITSAVLVRHRVVSGVNTQVNVNASGLPSNGLAHSGRIDARAQYAVFSDDGTNLVGEGAGTFYQVYLKALVSGEVVRLSVTSTNQSASDDSGYNSNSSFGPPITIGNAVLGESSPFVSFISVASNLASVGLPDSTTPFVFRSAIITPTPTAAPTNTPTPTPTPRTLTKNIQISEPPEIEVVQKDSKGFFTIQIAFENFILDPVKIKSDPGLAEIFASKKARLTYHLEIRKVGSKMRITRVVSRNTATIRKLTAGRYTVRYRVVGTKGSKQIQSRWSPRASVTLS